MSELESLKEQLSDKEAELLKLRLELIDVKIAELQHDNEDKEMRLRAVETSRTRFETIAWLALGGGGLSAINILWQFIRR